MVWGGIIIFSCLTRTLILSIPRETVPMTLMVCTYVLIHDMFNSVVIFLLSSPWFALGLGGCLSRAQVLIQHSQQEEGYLTPDGTNVCESAVVWKQSGFRCNWAAWWRSVLSKYFLFLCAAEASRRHRGLMNLQAIVKLCMCRRYRMWRVHRHGRSHCGLVRVQDEWHSCVTIGHLERQTDPPKYIYRPMLCSHQETARN